MASAPQPEREPTEVDSTPAGGHRRRRGRAVALIVVGGLVFLISGVVLLNSARGEGESSDGGAAPAAPAQPEETQYFDEEPGDAPLDLPLAENQGANGAPDFAPAVVTLADAESELTAMADTLAKEPAFSEQIIDALSVVAETVTTSLDEAIEEGATGAIRLLEQADETLDDIRSAAEPGGSAPGTSSELRAAATLVAAADDAWPEPPIPEPTLTPQPTPAPSSIELNDYIAMAGAVGGLLTAVAGMITAVAEWRRTRRARAAARTTGQPAGASASSSDLDETIRPS
jgi:hypothetical protein